MLLDIEDKNVQARLRHSGLCDDGVTPKAVLTIRYPATEEYRTLVLQSLADLLRPLGRKQRCADEGCE